MTSMERREGRYLRRKAKRQAKRAYRIQNADTMEKLFSYENVYQAGLSCCKGVGWKASIQTYKAQLIPRTAKLRKELLNSTWKSKGFKRFTIIERGKLRRIASVDIEERTIQRCLCKNLLIPEFSSSFIYDNGASLKGKGTDFAMNRLTCHLQRHYRKYGTDGYVLLFDFSDFFNSAPHEPISFEINRRIPDGRICTLIETIMNNFAPIGFGLGSQTSQIECVMIPNPLDHMIKEKLHIKGYGRYMDDGYLIHHDKSYLEYCLSELNSKCNEIGITLNTRKTRIIPIKHGFVFLKTKFTLTETGKVLRKVNRDSAKRMHRKLRIYADWLITGRFTEADVICSFNSWKGHMERCNSYRILKRMTKELNKMLAAYKKQQTTMPTEIPPTESTEKVDLFPLQDKNKSPGRKARA